MTADPTRVERAPTPDFVARRAGDRHATVMDIHPSLSEAADEALRNSMATNLGLVPNKSEAPWLVTSSKSRAEGSPAASPVRSPPVPGERPMSVDSLDFLASVPAIHTYDPNVPMAHTQEGPVMKHQCIGARYTWEQLRARRNQLECEGSTRRSEQDSMIADIKREGLENTTAARLFAEIDEQPLQRSQPRLGSNISHGPDVPTPWWPPVTVFTPSLKASPDSTKGGAAAQGEQNRGDNNRNCSRSFDRNRDILDTFTNPRRDRGGRLELLRDLAPALRSENNSKYNTIRIYTPGNYSDSPVNGKQRYLFRTVERAAKYHNLPGIPPLPVEATSELSPLPVENALIVEHGNRQAAAVPPSAHAVGTVRDLQMALVAESAPLNDTTAGASPKQRKLLASGGANGEGGLPRNRCYVAAAITRGVLPGRSAPRARERHERAAIVVAQEEWLANRCSMYKVARSDELHNQPLQVREEKLRRNERQLEHACTSLEDRLAELANADGRDAHEIDRLEWKLSQCRLQQADAQRQTHVAAAERAERAAQSERRVRDERAEAEATFATRVAAARSVEAVQKVSARHQSQQLLQQQASAISAVTALQQQTTAHTSVPTAVVVADAGGGDPDLKLLATVNSGHRQPRRLRPRHQRKSPAKMSVEPSVNTAVAGSFLLSGCQDVSESWRREGEPRVVTGSWVGDPAARWSCMQASSPLSPPASPTVRRRSIPKQVQRQVLHGRRSPVCVDAKGPVIEHTT